jgi:ribosomal protein S18 acetylase RimI-like enzyme
VNVRPAWPEDAPRAATALAEAFDDDPPMQWFLPEERRRARRLRPYFQALIRHVHLPRGEVWVSEDPAGAAGWVAPGQWPIPGRLRWRVAPIELRTFYRHPLRAIRGEAELARHHPTEPHWYLEFIGVERAGRGQGAGSALLRPMLERCDAEGVGAYLNAGSARSRELYRRHGFEVSEEFRLPSDGPPLWRMWRAPR